MITLYQFSTSPFTEKVRRAFNYKGVAFEVHEVERAKVPEGQYADVSPTGKFPAIKWDDKVVWDSTDILYFLEERHPQNPIIPGSPRELGLAHAIEEWADESLYFYEMTMRLTWESNLDAALDEFSASMPQIPKDQLKQMIVQGVTQLTQAQGVGRKPKEQIITDLERHLTALEGMLEGRQWLVGEQLSIADLAVMGQLTALRYAKETNALLEGKPGIAGWIDRVNELAPK